MNTASTKMGLGVYTPPTPPTSTKMSPKVVSVPVIRSFTPPVELRLLRPLPRLLYRVHRSRAQAAYSVSAGFTSKNKSTTFKDTTTLVRFGLAHLQCQTNVSSPFLSAYDDERVAEEVAEQWAQRHEEEEVFVVAVDTDYLDARYIYEASSILDYASGYEERQEVKPWLHWGERVVLYRIPACAIRYETRVARAREAWRRVGLGRPA